MGTSQFYIPSEYTETETIKLDNFPEFIITYRPLNIIESAKFSDKALFASSVVEKKKAVELAIMANLELIKSHIVAWSLTKPDGSAVDPQDIEELKRLNPYISNKICAVLRGGMGTPEELLQEEKELKN